MGNSGVVLGNLCLACPPGDSVASSGLRVTDLPHRPGLGKYGFEREKRIFEKYDLEGDSERNN